MITSIIEWFIVTWNTFSRMMLPQNKQRLILPIHNFLWQDILDSENHNDCSSVYRTLNKNKCTDLHDKTVPAKEFNGNTAQLIFLNLI